MNKLKPCPFCGAEAEELKPSETRSIFWKIRCKNCYASMAGSHRGMNQEKWNTRAETAMNGMKSKWDYYTERIGQDFAIVRTWEESNGCN